MTTFRMRRFDVLLGCHPPVAVTVEPSLGWITKDVFVHISAVERSGSGTLNEGQT